MSADPEGHLVPPTTLQVALNGGVGDHRMPRTPQETARQAAASVAEGATSIDLHAYDDDGVETLEAGFVAATLTAVRARCPGIPVNMTTFADVEPDPRRRHALVSGWTVLPDLVPANQGEDGIGELAAMLAARGVGVEACLLSDRDTELFLARGHWDRYQRVFVEPTALDPGEAVADAARTARALTDAGCGLEQVHHGVGVATWSVLTQAVRLGHGIRVGLEDTDVLADGTPAPDNAGLVAAAATLLRSR